MPLQDELVGRLRELLGLELNLRPYVREWKVRVHDLGLQERLAEIEAAIGMEADRLALSLGLLDSRPQLSEGSLLLEAFRLQDTVLAGESLAEVEVHCVVSLLALTNLKDSLYQSAIFMAEAIRHPEVERVLREALARLQHERAHLQEHLFLLLARASFEARQEAA